MIVILCTDQPSRLEQIAQFPECPIPLPDPRRLLQRYNSRPASLDSDIAAAQPADFRIFNGLRAPGSEEPACRRPCAQSSACNLLLCGRNCAIVIHDT